MSSSRLATGRGGGRARQGRSRGCRQPGRAAPPGQDRVSTSGEAGYEARGVAGGPDAAGRVVSELAGAWPRPLRRRGRGAGASR
jgi:hypothetical protein